ncbi:hypothetical protein [Metabacillus schmidteae]|uniref:hypothetical protein n=1 Tax=Metabacillus schmidteae TaxID=2730405 RepID=UPI00158A570E|nr:hypothetical protein [Metabacillus schmidteae]
MAYEFVLTYIFTFLVLVIIIQLYIKTYLPKGKAGKKKGYTILLIQSFIISVLLTWVM